MTFSAAKKKKALVGAPVSISVFLFDRYFYRSIFLPVFN